MRALFFILLSYSLSNNCTAGELPNYFMTQEERKQVDFLRFKNPTVKPIQSYGDLKLTAVLEVAGNKLVEVNGIYLAEGEEKQGIKVHKINTTFVELTYLDIKGRVELGKVYPAYSWINKTK